MNVVMVDSGGANIGSVVYALERLGVKARLSADPELIQAAERVILPGVGAAAEGMRRLGEHGLVELIPRLRQPVLGICLGMQLMFQGSAEGATDCLGVFQGRAGLLPDDPDHRVPHMGWNGLRFPRSCPLFQGVEQGSHVYFVHSYALPVTDDIVAVADHGIEFGAAAWRDNFYATQFHPERSAWVGERILKNFLELPCS
ncbi:MAG: imidazole glycerol phosphate synthase subunit HisH [Xanthomonadales bacterium]|nr:imidazole glycerol phosphate synthase subunit HisH [Xanthomonadales bacterium]